MCSVFDLFPMMCIDRTSIFYFFYIFYLFILFIKLTNKHHPLTTWLPPHCSDANPCPSSRGAILWNPILLQSYFSSLYSSTILAINKQPLFIHLFIHHLYGFSCFVLLLQVQANYSFFICFFNWILFLLPMDRLLTPLLY